MCWAFWCWSRALYPYSLIQFPSFPSWETESNCKGKELEFLVNPLKQNCPFKWRGFHERTQFYHKCLGKIFSRKVLALDKNYNSHRYIYCLENLSSVYSLASKAKIQRRRLQQIAYTLNKQNRKSGEMDIGSGSAMIAGKFDIGNFFKEAFVAISLLDDLLSFSCPSFCLFLSLSFSQNISWFCQLLFLERREITTPWHICQIQILNISRPIYRVSQYYW